VSDEEDETPSSSRSTPPVPPSTSKPAPKTHQKSQSVGNVAAELLATNSQHMKASQEVAKARLKIMQSNQEISERKLKLAEETAKLEMKVRGAKDILTSDNMPEELKKKASDFLMKFLDF
jgi:rRNA maturation endonuclease Nob1